MKKLIFVALSLVAGLLASDYVEGLNAYKANDYKKAKEIFEKACDGNDALACYNLGLLYKKGQGVKQNSQHAKTLFNKACYFGFQNACEYY